MDRQVGRYQKGERQVIGDRVVLNPRTRLCSLRDAEGNVFDTFRLSLEVCGCGYARAGVGWAAPRAVFLPTRGRGWATEARTAGTASDAGSCTHWTGSHPRATRPA